MIFPFPKVSFSFHRCPITWVLVLLNAAMFFAFYTSNVWHQIGMEKILDDEYFYKTQASVYKFYVDNHVESYNDTQKKMVSNNIENQHKARVVASFALSDQRFVNDIMSVDLEGDKVAITHWKKNFKKLLEIQKSAPNYQLGLLSNSSLFNLISYQFMHANFGHLMSNMIFLFLFGALLESLFGGLLLLLTYFASGIIAALVFLNFSMYVNSPLIGASGSVSGILAAYCLANYKNKLRFFYFLYIPKPEYMGFVYFPPWILLIYWFLTDLTGYLSQVTEFAGVAYTAHMGGHLAGIVIALSILFLWKKKTYLDSSHQRAGEMTPLSVLIRSKTSAHRIFGDASRFHKLP